MQPNESVHHETIRLVSLSFRFRSRMPVVLSTLHCYRKLVARASVGGSCAPSRDAFTSRLRRHFLHRATERSIHLIPFLHLWPESLEARVEFAAKKDIEMLVAP